jgi:hypothetical protein
MTGQVKEDILSRFGELGVFVNEGKLLFNPRLLRKEEFLKEPEIFTYVDIDNEVKEIQIAKDSLCFTYCQIPIIYKLSEKEALKVEFYQGPSLEFTDLNIDMDTSKKVFERTGEINRIIVSIIK